MKGVARPGGVHHVHLETGHMDDLILPQAQAALRAQGDDYNLRPHLQQAAASPHLIPLAGVRWWEALGGDKDINQGEQFVQPGPWPVGVEGDLDPIGAGPAGGGDGRVHMIAVQVQIAGRGDVGPVGLVQHQLALRSITEDAAPSGACFHQHHANL